MQRKTLDVIYQTWEFDSKPLLSSINQHEAMRFIFLTQKLTTSTVMIMHEVNEETPGQRESISGVSMNPQHIPAKPLHHFKLKTTSLHWSRAANTHKHKRTTATNINDLKQKKRRKVEHDKWRSDRLSRAQTTVSSSNRSETFWRVTVVKNEDFHKNNIFLD